MPGIRASCAIVIASPSVEVNRFSRLPKMPVVAGFSRAGESAALRVQIRFIAIFKLPFKFYGSYGRHKPANGERELSAMHNGHQSDWTGAAGGVPRPTIKKRPGMFQGMIESADAVPAET